VAGPSGAAVGGALGFTPGITPEAAAALNGTADGNAASSSGNAAWRGTLMQLLGSDFAQHTGAAAAGGRFRGQPAGPGQHGGGSGLVTPGSDMDMMTPAAAGAGRGAVRAGLFDTPVEGRASGAQQQQQQQQPGDESPSTPT
jgi:hypothetical protein